MHFGAVVVVASIMGIALSDFDAFRLKEPRGTHDSK